MLDATTPGTPPSAAPQGHAVYRALQRHLDGQALGFPATRSGAEIRMLAKLFTPEEARLALHLSYKPLSTDAIARAASSEFGREQALGLLRSMVCKGAIGWKEKADGRHWFLLPMVVGMYESQDGRIIPDLQVEIDAYTSSPAYTLAFLSAAPSQLRTIPVGIDVPVRHDIASYEQIRAIVENAPGPFVVVPCICRAHAAWKGTPCRRTTRTETCLGFGYGAAIILERMHGRQIEKDEVITILRENERDGLVLQPSNARNPVFVCSCCGCCCGMLGMQKRLPHPLNFWTTNHNAVVNRESCRGCGKCVTRCQVSAMAVHGQPKKAEVDRNRCIGCGVCISTCPSAAIRLETKRTGTVPPGDEEELHETIRVGRQRGWQPARLAARMLLGRRT